MEQELAGGMHTEVGQGVVPEVLRSGDAQCVGRCLSPSSYWK